MNKLTTNQNLFEHIKNLIEQTKQNVAVAVNSSMTLMYWNIGKTINDEILQNLLILKFEDEKEKIFLENK